MLMNKRYGLAFLLILVVIFVGILIASNQSSSPHKPTGQSIEEVTLVQEKKIHEKLALRSKELANLPIQERQQVLASEAAILEHAAAKVEEEARLKSLH